MASAWTQLLGSTDFDSANALTTGLDGSIYVAGYTAGTLDGLTNSGGNDAFLAKYNTDGAKVWTKLLSSSGYENANALSTGTDGSIYVSGTSGGDLDGQTGSGSQDAFLSKFSADGSKAWTRLMGYEGATAGYGLTVGLDGAIYVTGVTWTATNEAATRESNSAFIAKYSSDGTKAWSELLATGGSDYATALATGLDGSVYVVGWADGAPEGQTNSGGNDVFLSKYSTNGTKVWTQLLGTSGNDFACALTIGLDGSVFLCGTTDGSFSEEASTGQIGSFLAKYSDDGYRAWCSMLSSSQAGFGTALTTGEDGAVYVGGWTSLVPDRTATTGSSDYFLTKFDSDGTESWTKSLGTSGEDRALALTTGLDGSIYIGGCTDGSVLGLSNTGAYDAFLTKLSVGGPQITFAAGQTTAKIVLHPTADVIQEGSETLIVTVLSGTGYTVGSNLLASAMIDDTGPTVTTFSPSDDATAVAIGANIELTFSEAVQRGAGTIILKTSAGEVVATYDAATSTNLSISGSTLTLNPKAELAFSTVYKLEFGAGSVKDIAGNGYAGVANYNFTTLDSVVVGSSAGDSLIGTKVADRLFGLEGNDTLSGAGGSDTLYGGAGDDSLTGGTGADTFLVGEGTDAITDLGNGADVLTVAVGATANARLFAAWTATAGTTNGGETNISTYGLAVNLSAVTTGSVGFSVTNTGAATKLSGSALADTLNGGSGNDTMAGGLGNDIYVVDSTTDAITEYLAGGIDTVVSSVSQATLAAYLENLTLSGTADLSATGNSLANVLTGNAGNNGLNGATGADTMIGGAGNDTYVVDNAGDMVYESTTTTSGLDAGGNDAVQSSVSFRLSQFVERLTLTGTAAINASGNSLANTLVGNAGANTVDGGTGNDTLTGGVGADTFIVGAGADAITDLGNGVDVINVAAGATTNASVYAAWTATAATSNSGIANISTYGLAVNLGAVTMGTSGFNATNSGTATNLTGSALADVLTGGIGNDTLSGGLGMDVLVGGTGADFLFGGIDSVKDIYKFNAVSDSTTTARDKIYNFFSGIDKLDFSGFDANSTLTGAQAFSVTSVGSAPKSFSIWATVRDADCIVSVDTDGITSTIEFQIQLMGVNQLAFTDFVL
jgi:Ca2+-binding RTX toxin-like protein